MAEAENQAKRRNRVQLVAIVAVALISLGGSYALFYAARSGDLWGTTNRGAFVSPPVTVMELDIRDVDGQPLAEGETWWLWVVSDGPCDPACDAALHQLRQLHVLLNKDASRVRRALVRADGEGVQASLDEALRTNYPQLQLLTGDLTRVAPGVYIVDPIGNLVFHYDIVDAGKPVLEDLKKLLKVSQIG